MPSIAQREAAAPAQVPALRRRWLRACVAAEAIGMTAASSAAVVADRLGSAAALTVVVVGGLVEGAALGWLQGGVLAQAFPALSRRLFGVATVAVAGLGWAAASAPAAFADDGTTDAPPLLAILVMAAVLGVVMGSALGAAQAITLRGAVAHPWRWIGASAAGWTPTMAVIFVGATAPDASWPVSAIVGTGVLTGVAAGAVLGLVTGWFLPSLTGTSPSGRLVLHLLTASRGRGIGRTLVGLEVAGRRSGRRMRFPVQYAVNGDRLVVVPGHPVRKTWWRNIGRSETQVDVLYQGALVPTTARLVVRGDPDYVPARLAYRRRWPRRALPDTQPIIVVTAPGLSERQP
jgi:hypothetical protein